MNTKSKAETTSEGKGEINHHIIVWALAAVLASAPESFNSRAIVAAADRLGAASGDPDTFDLRAEIMLRELLDGHTACAYDLDGQDRAKGRRAYRKLVALAGGPEGAPEPEDKQSCAWLCWTMRRIRAEFYAEPGDAGSEQEAEAFRRYGAAWREVESLMFPLWNETVQNKQEGGGVSAALAILAPLVRAKQSREYWAAERRMSRKAKGGA